MRYNFTKKDRKTGKINNCGFMNLETSGERAELYFYGDICGDSWRSEWFQEDKAPQDVVNFLKELDGQNKPIDIFVNSPGGDVFGGIAIYNILKRYQGEKTAHIDGIAASIAGIIPFACDIVKAPESAQIMMHKPYTYCEGNADDLQKCIETLDICENSIIDIYMENVRDGITREQIEEMIDRETWMTCKEATEFFNIEIEDTVPISACFRGSKDKKRKLQLENDLFRLRNEVFYD